MKFTDEIAFTIACTELLHDAKLLSDVEYWTVGFCTFIAALFIGLLFPSSLVPRWTERGFGASR